MSKLTLNDVVNLQSETTAVTTINNNSDAIETAIENTLSRDGTAPNYMSANLDLNSNRIINLAAPVDDNDAVRYVDIGNIDSAALTQAHTDALTASAAATTATTQATAAAASAASAAGYIGAATSAATLTTPRTISVGTDATGGVSFNGSANVTIPLTLANTAVTPASYGTTTAVPQITVDSKGRLTAAANVAIASAPKWTAPITFNLTGDVTGTASVDGSGTVNLATTAATTGPTAYGVISITAGVITVNKSSGVTSITRPATGRVLVTLSSARGDTYYRVTPVVQKATANSALWVGYTQGVAKTMTTFELACVDNTASLQDAKILEFTVFD